MTLPCSIKAWEGTSQTHHERKRLYFWNLRPHASCEKTKVKSSVPFSKRAWQQWWYFPCAHCCFNRKYSMEAQQSGILWHSVPPQATWFFHFSSMNSKEQNVESQWNLIQTKGFEAFASFLSPKCQTSTLRQRKGRACPYCTYHVMLDRPLGWPPRA